MEGSGALMIGNVPPATFNVTLQYTPLISVPAHPHYYVARLENLAVNGTILPVDQVRSVKQNRVALFTVLPALVELALFHWAAWTFLSAQP